MFTKIKAVVAFQLLLVNHAFIAQKYLYLLEQNIIHHNLDDHIPTRDLKSHNLVYQVGVPARVLNMVSP